MLIEAEPAPTARDSISAAFDAVESGTQTLDAPVVETQQSRDDRARDEAGRFAKQQADDAAAKSVAAPQAPKPANAILSTGAAAQPAPAAAASVPTDKRPDSWKKDYDAHWASLSPEVKAYVHQREKEYQSGVSAYRGEAENARQLNEAVAPFMPVLQQHGVEAPAMIRNLFSAHQRLALGSPQDKVQMGVKLIQDYGIDPQALFQVLSGQQPTYQLQAQQPQYQSPSQQGPELERVVDQLLMKKEITNEYQRFITEAPEKYPHYEAVKDTMAGLLQAELAQDYVSAYEAAIRHPKHADIWNAMQEQQRAQADADAKAKAQAAVGSARARTVSVKPSTPSGAVNSGKANPSLRDSLSDAFDTVTSSRV